MRGSVKTLLLAGTAAVAAAQSWNSRLLPNVNGTYAPQPASFAGRSWAVAVRGEERIARVLGSGEKSGIGLVQKARGELILSACPARHKRQAPSVGRNGGGDARAGDGLRSQIDAEAGQRLRRGRLAKMHERERSGDHRKCSCRDPW